MTAREKLHWAQAALALLYLFAGIYKGVVPFPVDWTIVTGLLLCVALIPDWRIVASLAVQPAVWIFLILLAYLMISGWPLTDFGRWKVIESGLLGLPALTAAYVFITTGADKHFRIICVAAGVVSAVAITIMSMRNDTLAYSIQFLSGGYQLPAALLGFGFMAVALTPVIPSPWSYAAGGLLSFGMFSTGSTIGTFAALFVAAAVALWTFGFRPKPALIWAAVVILPMVAMSMVKPPPSITRILLKYHFLEVQLDQPIDIEGLEGGSGNHPIKGVYVDIAGSRTDVTDRAFLFRSAWQFWERAPVFGHGFGSLQYAAGYRTPHNIPLELLAEGGLIAFILGAAFAGLAGMPCLTARSPTSAYPLAIFLLTMATAMVGGYFIGRVQMFAIGAVLAAAQHRETALSGFFGAFVGRNLTDNSVAYRSRKS
jgi:hypothetical protein